MINSKIDNNSFFSKDYTTVLKGLCCLIVIYVHVHDDYTNSIQDAIGSFAYICVTLFFLVSAYGMMQSVERKANYLRNFWRNRLIALLLPCVLVNIVSFALSAVSTDTYKYSIIYHLNGYVAVLLQWCIWFYIVEKCSQKWFPGHESLTDIVLIAGVVVSSLYNYLFVHAEISAQSGWCFERIGLVWGILLHKYFRRIKDWMYSRRWQKVTILLIFSCVLGCAYLKYKLVFFWGAYLLKIILGAAIIALLFTSTSNRKFSNRINLWLGNISYEVYLSHGIVMSYLAILFPLHLDSGLFILLTVVTTVILSAGIHSIGKPLVSALRSK